MKLGGNQLSTVHKAIGNLTALVSLDLKSNQIVNLPDELGNLISCKKMDLTHNMIQELPWGLGNLRGILTQLNVAHNPLVVPPKTIVGKGTGAMLVWLFKNEEAGRKARISGLGITTK